MDVSLAYYAGLFDGEGWFSISRNKRPDIRWPYAFQVQARLCMREEFAIRELQQAFGGSVRRKRPRRAKHSVIYDWAICGRNVHAFCVQMGPYVRCKRAQLQLAQTFQQAKNLHGNRALSANEYEFYASCYGNMRLLNQKGVGKATLVPNHPMSTK